MSQTVTVSSKGQIVLPLGVRRKFNIMKGKKLSLNIQQGKIILKPTKSTTDQLCGIMEDDQQSTPELMQELREEDTKREKELDLLFQN